MTEQEEKQLWLEIEHIFDSGPNELRVFNMVKTFIERRDEVLSPIPNHVRCSYFYPDKTTSSATKCICGREKWEHHQSVYLSSETGMGRNRTTKGEWRKNWRNPMGM